MKRMQTNKDIQIKKGLYSAIPGCIVEVPQGSAVEWSENCNSWLVSPSVFPEHSMDRHDANFYGFRIAEEDVEEV